MKPWLLLPIAIPAVWGALTWGELWPEAWEPIAANPFIGFGGVILGVICVYVIERAFVTGPDRLPTEREISRMAEPMRDPLVGGVRESAGDPESVGDPRSSSGRRPHGDLRVPMPDDPTNAPPERR